MKLLRVKRLPVRTLALLAQPKKTKKVLPLHSARRKAQFRRNLLRLRKTLNQLPRTSLRPILRLIKRKVAMMRRKRRKNRSSSSKTTTWRRLR